MRFSNARFWFLTQDTKLPRFAEKVPDNGDQPSELPFCISPSAWVQVARALTPRTEDFDRTVVDLLASPFVGYGGAVDQSVVSEVVGRMDDLEDASPELALAVLTDTAKVREIEAMTAQDDEERVGQTVRTALPTARRPENCRKRPTRASTALRRAKSKPSRRPPLSRRPRRAPSGPSRHPKRARSDSTDSGASSRRSAASAPGRQTTSKPSLRRPGETATASRTRRRTASRRSRTASIRRTYAAAVAGGGLERGLASCSSVFPSPCSFLLCLSAARAL